MNILLVTGPLYPQFGNNTNLLGKVSAFLQNGNSVHMYANAFRHRDEKLVNEAFGLPVHWGQSDENSFKCRVVYPKLTRVIDKNGYSDYLLKSVIKDELKILKREYKYDAVIATCEPFASAVAVSELKGVKKLLYLMDPPASISGQEGRPYRNKKIKSLVKDFDSILTTPFIHKALLENNLVDNDSKISDVGFPMIDSQSCRETKSKDEKIDLLFCGWLYSNIRSPKYFLNILEHLDERFRVTFMGKECDKLCERFEINTKAELITLPMQPYDKALEAMAKSDVLINIGNSVPVHMPSKTLEYINTGKPIVNFYKFEDCPTLYYTSRYPICKNVFEKDECTKEIVEDFINFCVENKGKTVEREYIEREYNDCTPKYIAEKMIERLGNING